jgi:DNA-binding NarL/FixJ family response regulator
MQAQLLTTALRRHSEFHVATCPMDILSILHAVTSKLPSIAVLSLNSSARIPETVMILRRFHLSYPGIPKILLVDSCDRDLVVRAFRSGARGIFPLPMPTFPCCANACFAWPPDRSGPTPSNSTM